MVRPDCQFIEVPAEHTRSPWLRHLLPPEKRPPRSTEPALDLLEVKLEEEVAKFALWLQHSGAPEQAARQYSINTLVEKSLALQRDYAPDDYMAMLGYLVAMEPRASAIQKAIVRAFRKRTNWGVLLLAAGEFLAGLLIGNLWLR